MYFETGLGDKEFAGIIRKAVDSIPQEFKEKLDNVSFFVLDHPTPEQVSKSGSRGGFLLGLYEGVPHTRRGRYGIGPTMPDRITIFKKNIERIASTKKDVEKIVRSTILHEIAHHFGMDEETVRRAERQRRRTI